MKNKLIIFLLFVYGLLQAQAPLNFSSRLNITSVSGSDPYTLVGVIQDDLGLWSASDLNTSQDSIYHLEGSDLLIYRITTISSAVGNNFTIIVDDIMNSGILPSTGNEWAAMAFTTNFQFPMEIGNLATNFKATIDNRFKQRLDAALQAAGGGGATDLTFTGASSPYTLVSSTGTDVTMAASTNMTITRSSNELSFAAANANLAVTGTSSPLTLTSSTGNDVTITAGTNVTLTGSAGDITINSTNPGGDLTAITATSPLSVTSGTGPTPDVALTGIVPVANGGTGSATQNYVDLTTNQTFAGIKRTSGGLLYGSSAPLTGQLFGTTTGTLFGLKRSASFSAESAWQDFSGLVIESNLSGSLETTRLIATGNDTAPYSSAFEWGVRPPASSRDVGYEMKLTAYSPAPGESYGQLSIDGANPGALATNPALMLPSRGISIDDNGVGETFHIDQEGVLGLVVRADNAIQTYVNSSTGGWVFFSDSILKHSIQDVTLTKGQILGFRAYTYMYDGSDSTRFGVIAQDFLGDTVLNKLLIYAEDTLLSMNPLSVAALGLEAASNLQGQVNTLVTGGSASVTAASALDINTDNTVFIVSGNTTMNTLSVANRTTGAEVTLLFTGTPTVTDDSGLDSGNYKEIHLAGSTNFSATADDVLTLIYDGTKWLEKSRSVN